MGDEFHGNGWTYNTATEMLRFWEWMTRVAMLFARPRSEALASSTSFICTCMAPLCRLLFSGRGRRAGTARPVAELQSPAKFEFGMVA